MRLNKPKVSPAPTRRPARWPKKDTLGKMNCIATSSAKGYTFAGTSKKPKMDRRASLLHASPTAKANKTPEKPTECCRRKNGNPIKLKMYAMATWSAPHNGAAQKIQLKNLNVPNLDSRATPTAAVDSMLIPRCSNPVCK